eukprot:43927_1
MSSHHAAHPSLAELKRKKSAQTAKETFLEKAASVDTEPSDKEEINPASIDGARLKQFRHSGDKYLKILVSSIQLYKDKEFTKKDATVQFNQNDIMQGTYIDGNKKVLFGDPCHLYCHAKDVEPVDIDHSTYLHKQKEQQKRRPKTKAKTYRNKPSHVDEYKIAENNGSDIDVEMAEKVKLIDANKATANKLRDPSLSDYLSVAGKGYAKVDNASDIEDSDAEEPAPAPIIIMKRDAWYKRHPYDICIVSCLFLCLLILDVLLMVFLTDLKVIIGDMDVDICDEEDVQLVYDVKYMFMSGMALIGLSIFCTLMYFAPRIAQRSMGKVLVNAMCFMMMMLYLGASVWQIIGMNNAINGGIDGLSSDTECNATPQNTEYIEQMKETYSVITIITLLKIFEGIAMCIVGCSVGFVRSRSNRKAIK